MLIICIIDLWWLGSAHGCPAFRYLGYVLNGVEFREVREGSSSDEG